MPDDQLEFLARISANIEKFLKSDEQSLELEKCNSFQRRLIYQTAKNKFGDVCSLSSVQKSGGDRVILVVRAPASTLDFYCIYSYMFSCVR